MSEGWRERRAGREENKWREGRGGAIRKEEGRRGAPYKKQSFFE